MIRRIRRSSGANWLLAAFRIAQVRLRFLAVLLVIFLVVGKWDLLCNYWDRWTAPAVDVTAPVSGDTEYWCPMCPGVVSDWPGKCPVCNMDLVRRSKQEAVPLPSGVMARMQLSPYRIQLAGVQTSEVTYQHLLREITTSGRVAYDDSTLDRPRTGRVSPQDAGQASTVIPRPLHVTATVFESDVPFLACGQAADILWESFPGRGGFPGRIEGLSFTTQNGEAAWRLRVAVDVSSGDLPVGSRVRVRIRVPVSARPWSARALTDGWSQETLLEQTGAAFLNPGGLLGGAGLSALVHAAGTHALQMREQVLAVPESAVVDTGSEQIVYIDRGQGMFDAVAVRLGPRCGNQYPVLTGLAPGQRVVSRGAFLLDAESHLSPATASMYFGASSSTPPAETPHAKAHSHASRETGPLAGLSAEDRTLVAAQGVCPVLPDNRLGSMGPPCKVVLRNQVVFLCCRGCRHEALAHPQETLNRLAQLKHQHASPRSAK